MIIGNPPYVEYKDVQYKIGSFVSLEASDLYAFIMERSLHLSIHSGKIGMIVPMSCFTVDGFSSIQKLFKKNNDQIWISNWSGDAHPAKLFEGVNKRLHIVVSSRGSSGRTYTTKYFKWYSEEREILFETRPFYLSSQNEVPTVFTNSLPKLGTNLEISIIKRILNGEQLTLSLSSNTTPNIVYYTRKVSFFLQFLDFIPRVKDGRGRDRQPSELKELCFKDVGKKILALSSLSSSTFYWFYIINSDCRNLNKREIVAFRIPKTVSRDSSVILASTLKSLMRDFERNSEIRTVKYQQMGDVSVQYFNFRASKPIIDEIDKVLAEHYGFTPEELDFIINYDIKYRMGKELEEGE